MRLLIIPFFLFVSSYSSANNEHSGCMVADEVLPIGESRFIIDPAINTAEFGRDWRGYLVECRSEIVVQPGNGKLGSVVKKTKPVLVLSDVSEEFYEHLLLNVKNGND